VAPVEQEVLIMSIGPIQASGGLVLGHRSLTTEDLIAFGMALGDE
jgi:hypothetical protein